MGCYLYDISKFVFPDGLFMLIHSLTFPEDPKSNIRTKFSLNCSHPNVPQVFDS